MMKWRDFVVKNDKVFVIFCFAVYKGESKMEIFLQTALLALGLFMLIKGADWFVDGAAGLAAKFKIPQLLIGLTIVAMGTSAPEAAVSISSALKGSADITIGNIVGSNIFNIFIILGLSAVITPLSVGKTTIRYEVPFLFSITALLLVQGLDGTIGLIDGIVLFFSFLVYLVYLCVTAKRQKEKEIESPVRYKLWRFIFLTVSGLALIILGSVVSVDAATFIAKNLGISERIIGLTVVAFGTSLPELFTSICAARKGNADIAIGNIVGSNIFNILFVTGQSSLIVPIPFASEFFFDAAVAGISTLMLLVFCLKKKKLNRIHGAIMLFAYIVYFAVIL